MILKLLAKAMGSKAAETAGYCPEEDQRVKRLIEAKMSVRRIQDAIEEDKRARALAPPLEEPKMLETSDTDDAVIVPGIEVEEITQEEAEALLEQTNTVHVEDMVDEEPVFVVSEEDVEDGTHFGQGLPGIEVTEFGFTPDCDIPFDGDGDEVLTAWGAFSLKAEPVVEEEKTTSDWGDVRLGREEVAFKRGSL